jgi:hypothetical protein
MAWLGDDGTPPRDGFYADFRNMITGVGWIAAGPGYRRHSPHNHIADAANGRRPVRAVQRHRRMPTYVIDRFHQHMLTHASGLIMFRDVLND